MDKTCRGLSFFNSYHLIVMNTAALLVGPSLRCREHGAPCRRPFPWGHYLRFGSAKEDGGSLPAPITESSRLLVWDWANSVLLVQYGLTGRWRISALAGSADDE